MQAFLSGRAQAKSLNVCAQAQVLRGRTGRFDLNAGTLPAFSMGKLGYRYSTFRFVRPPEPAATPAIGSTRRY